MAPPCSLHAGSIGRSRGPPRRRRPSTLNEPGARIGSLAPMALPQVCVTYVLRESARGPEVLLGRKKHGLGEGKLVGLGGKLHAAEHPVEAAVREIAEESGLVVHPDSLRSAGMLTYLFPAKPAWSQESWVYVCREFAGEPAESSELVPEWHAVGTIPFERMWSDARHWLPRALGSSFVRATYVFGDDLSTAIASDDRASGLAPIGRAPEDAR